MAESVCHMSVTTRVQQSYRKLGMCGGPPLPQHWEDGDTRSPGQADEAISELPGSGKDPTSANRDISGKVSEASLWHVCAHPHICLHMYNIIHTCTHYTRIKKEENKTFARLQFKGYSSGQSNSWSTAPRLLLEDKDS